MSLVAVAILFASPCFADETARTTFKDQGKGDARSVIFDDDLALGSGLSANDPTIRIRPFAPRRSLLTLRTNFVQELLASVEAI